MYEGNMAELQNLNQMLRDEHQALQIAFASIEDKLRKAQVPSLYTTPNTCILYLLYKIHFTF